MWWKIEYAVWDPFKEMEECIGDFEDKEETKNTWNETLNRFIELVKNEDVVSIFVTAMLGDQIFTPDAPYVLIYSAE